MKLKSYAKINLFLNIFGRRTTDSYHLLDSLVAFTEDIYDTIEINKTTGNSSVTVTDGEFAHLLANSDDNLITKVLNTLKLKSNYQVQLTKNIPVAAGIGGGSSNAAVILKYLLNTMQIKLADKEFTELCLKFGTDVLVCYRQKASYFTQIGDIIEDIKSFPEIWAIIVNPRQMLLSKDIYKIGVKKFSRKLTTKPYNFNNFDELIEFIKFQENGLEDPAIEVVPLIKILLNEIANLPNCHLARMSGSGPTCFGLFKTGAECKNAQQIFSQQHPQWWTKASRLI